MGLFEGYKNLLEEEGRAKKIHDFFTYRQGGFLSKELNLHYSLVDKDPWVVFKCDNDKYSFIAHGNEMNEDRVYWQPAAQREKKARFDGYADLFGLGPLRGVMKVAEDDQELGVFVKKGRIYELATDKEIKESFSPMEELGSAVIYYTMSDKVNLEDVVMKG